MSVKFPKQETKVVVPAGSFDAGNSGETALPAASPPATPADQLLPSKPASSNDALVTQLQEDYRRVRGELPGALKTLFDKAKVSPEAALAHIASIPDAQLRAMSDQDLAAVLSVLDRPTVHFKGGNLFHRAPANDLDAQLFRVLSAHFEGAIPATGQPLSVHDQAHVRAILTRMPWQGTCLAKYLSASEQTKLSAWSTRQLPPGDWRATMEYLWIVTGAHPAPGTSVQLIDQGGMAPDLSPAAAARRAELEKIIATSAPHTQQAQAAAAELRELPVGSGMKVIDNKGSLPELLAAIRSAKPGEPVWVNAFAFQSDFSGKQVAQALIEAKKRGCDVLAAYDPSGSAHSNRTNSDPAFFELLTHSDPPIPALPFPVGKGLWLEEKDKDWLSHLKDYVTGGTLFMGGRNLGDEYFSLWQDALFKLQGTGTADGADTFAWAWNYSLSEMTRRERLEHPKMSEPEFQAFFDRKYGNPKEISADFMRLFRAGLSPAAGAPTDPYKSPTIILHKGAFQDRNTEETLLAATETATQRYAMESPYASEAEIHSAVAAAKKRISAMQEMKDGAAARVGQAGPAAAALIPANPDAFPHVSLPTVDRPETAYLVNGRLLVKLDSPVGTHLPSAWKDLGAFALSTGSAAAMKGGPVQVVFPAYNNVAPEYYAIQSYYPALLAAGVEIYEYTGKPMNHSKLQVSDDVVVAGSSNTDARSWGFNNENIFIYDNKQLADDTWNRIQDDIRHSIRVTPEVISERKKDQSYMGELSKWLWSQKAAKKVI